MGTYEELKAAIRQVITTNGNNEITGALLQQTLLSMVNTIGANATFAGIATPSTNPGTPDQQLFYLAIYSGNYVNFNNKQLNKEVGIFYNSSGAWMYRQIIDYNALFWGSVYRDTYIDSLSKWRYVEGVESVFVNLKQGDIVIIEKNEQLDSSVSFIDNINVGVPPTFKNGTSGVIIVNGERTFEITEDCILFLLKTYPGQNYMPKRVTINGVDLLDFSSIISNVVDKNRITNLETFVTPFSKNKISKYYFGNDGGWIPQQDTLTEYIQVYKGEILKIHASVNYGSRFAFVTDNISTLEKLVFANNTNAAINLGKEQERTFEVFEDCKLIWLNNYGGVQDWNPIIFINDININDNLGSIVRFISQAIKDNNRNVEECVKSNDAKYFQKGNSPKSFAKKICLLAAGQSNTEGRVPYDQMPSSIKNAQPIQQCQYVKNSIYNGFTALNITGLWAFDLIVYYNLVTRANKDIFVIKWAEGGTSIDPLGDSNNHWTADYEKLTALSNSLLLKFESEIREHVATNGSEFDIRALLWHQGEGDRSELGTGSAERYYINLRNVFAYIRGVVGNERLPIISGTISRKSAQYDALIESAQYRLAQDDPYYFLIDMSGATLLDSYHFDAQSTIYFGEMVYDKLIDAGIISGTKINPIKPW